MVHLRGPCGHMHPIEGSKLSGRRVGQLIYIGSYRCQTVVMYVYRRSSR